ncbi:MAG: SurA N-terminal domain-containing protein [Acidobacteria bacterium]|nr:SurA N-terminal domain-containing protein [Acidobacteriota bacterium]
MGKCSTAHVPLPNSALSSTALLSRRACLPLPIRDRPQQLPEVATSPQFTDKLFRSEADLNSSLVCRHACVLLLALSAGLLASCGSRPSAQEVAAIVDGRKIYRGDLEKYFQNQTAGSNQPLSQEQATSLRLSILRELIENEILMRRAEKLGLLATDEEIDRKLNEIRSPYSREQFQQRLDEKKISLDDFRRDIRRALTADKVLRKEVTSKINITQQDIANYYQQNKTEFNLIEPRYHLAHILVTSSPGQGLESVNKAHNEADARRKVQGIMARLEAGEDFASVAMAYSEDSSTAANGGDLGIVPESALKQTDTATRESILKLKPGAYTPVIALASPQGKQVAAFRVVKLIAVEPAGQRDLSDPRVEQEIRKQLEDHREQLLKTAYYEVMRDQARVENFYAQEVLASAH